MDHNHGNHYVIEDRMLGENPEAWLGLDLNNGTTSQSAVAPTSHELDDCFKAHSPCLPGNITDDFYATMNTDDYLSNGTESSTEIPMNFDLECIPRSITDVSGNSGEQRDSLKKAQDVLNEIVGSEDALLTQQFQPHVARTGEGIAGPRQTIDICNQGTIPTPMNMQQPFSNPSIQHIQMIPNAQGATFAESTGPVTSNGQLYRQQATHHTATNQMVPVVQTQPVPSYQVGAQAQQRTPTFADMPLSNSGITPTQTHQVMEVSASQGSTEKQSQKPMSKSKKRTSKPAASASKAADTHAEAEVQSTSAGAGYNLPEYHDMQVEIYYRTVLKIKKRVSNPNGCLVYCNRPTGVVNAVDKISLPLLKEILQGQEEDTPENKQLQNLHKYTNKVLNVVEEGIHIYSNPQNGKIFAKRHCRAKVFFWSTVDDGKIDQAQELPREEATCIFDYDAYKKHLVEFLQQGQDGHVKCPWKPAIVLTFAQKWSTREQLNAHLVYAIVQPLRAQAQLEGLQLKAGVKPKNVNAALHTSMFLMSSLK